MAGIASLVIAGVAVAASITGAGISFSQAAKQRRKASQATKDSKELMRRARAKMQQNFYEKINVPLDAYERSFRENTAQQNQAIQSLQGANARTLAAGIGQVGALGVAANEADRLAMGEELYRNQLLKAKAQSDIKDELVSMHVGEAGDLQEQARDLEESSSAAFTSGFSALGSGLETAAKATPLYLSSQADSQASEIADAIIKEGTKHPTTQDMIIDPNQYIDDPTNPGTDIINPNYNKSVPKLDAQKNIIMRKMTRQEIMEAILKADPYSKRRDYRQAREDEFSAFDYSIFK